MYSACSLKQEYAKYDIVSVFLDTLIKFKESEIGFYYNEKPQYNEDVNTDSIYTVTDLSTGELVQISGKEIDSVNLSEYSAGMQHWENKEVLNKRVFLIRPMTENKIEYIKKSINKKEHNWILDILNLNKNYKSYHYNSEIFNEEEGVLFANYIEENKELYKYSLCGYIELSDVFFSKDKTKAILLYDFLFSYEGGHDNSGFGGALLFSKETNSWEIIKSAALWEV